MNRTAFLLILVAGIVSVTRASSQTFSDFETGTTEVDSISGLSGIQFLLGATAHRTVPPAGTDIVLANLRAFSNTNSADPLGPPANQYTLVVNLTDDTSKQSAALIFTGELDGNLRGGSSAQSSITNKDHDPLSRTVALGAYSYTVALGYYSQPGPPGSGQFGGLFAHVTASVPTAMQKAVKSLRIAGGLIVATADDITTLDIEKGGTSGGRIDLLDVVGWARKATGLDK